MNALADVRCLARPQFEQIESRFEPEFGVCWLRMKPHPRQCFNPHLLLEIRAFIDRIIDTEAREFPMIWWYREIPERSYVHGWKIGPSHYINQDLSNIWLDEAPNG